LPVGTSITPQRSEITCIIQSQYQVKALGDLTYLLTIVNPFGFIYLILGSEVWLFSFVCFVLDAHWPLQ
jgi:hypothetical protein